LDRDFGGADVYRGAVALLGRVACFNVEEPSVVPEDGGDLPGGFSQYARKVLNQLEVSVEHLTGWSKVVGQPGQVRPDIGQGGWGKLQTHLADHRIGNLGALEGFELDASDAG
jgi:hypothetical protein